MKLNIESTINIDIELQFEDNVVSLLTYCLLNDTQQGNPILETFDDFLERHIGYNKIDSGMKPADKVEVIRMFEKMQLALANAIDSVKDLPTWSKHK